MGRVPQEDAHTARVLLAVRTWSAYTSLAEAYMFDRYKTPTLVNAGAISPPQRAARCRRSRFTSMGSTTSTPAGNPADQVGAKSIPPITSSPDNDSQSSGSSALASKGFDHGSGDAQQQQHGRASFAAGGLKGQFQADNVVKMIVTAESQKLLKKLAGALHVEPVRCYGAHIPLSHIHTRYGAALRRPRTSSATRGQGPAGDHK